MLFSGSTLTKAEAKNFVDIGLTRLDPKRVEEVYNAHSTVSTSWMNCGTKRKLMKGSLRAALRDCGVHFSLEEIDLFFKQTDVRDDQSLDFDEFCSALNTPSKLQQWDETLQLPKLLGYLACG